MSNLIYAKLALEWLTAERAAHGEPTPSAHDDELLIATDRVHQVLSGEVKWSDATPGDKAIWRGKFRDVEKFDRWWRSSRPSDQLSKPPLITNTQEDDAQADPFNQTTPKAPKRGRRAPKPAMVPISNRERWYLNLYDTVQLSELPFGGINECGVVLRRDSRTTVLFGNANVGMIQFSNLLSPSTGGLGEDISFYLDTMYASATSLQGLVTASDFVFCVLGVGANPWGNELPLRELVMGIPVRRIITPRQNFYVRLRHMFPQQVEIPTLRVSIHLEGVAVRD